MAALDRELALEQGLDVRESRIPGAGQGLFVTRRFAKGTVLAEYRGDVLSLAKVLKMSVADRDYVMGGFGLNVHIDARRDLNVLGRYVNDNQDASQLNAEFVKLREERKALVTALRDIEAGEEVYASYGEGYWRVRGHLAATSPDTTGADSNGSALAAASPPAGASEL